MTRYAIWHRDDFFGNGAWRLDMDPDVVEIKEEPLLVFWNYIHHEEHLGTIGDIQIMDGEITGELELIEDPRGLQVSTLLDHKDVRLGGYYLDVVRDAPKKNVLSCTLRAVSVLIGGANPGAHL